MGQTQVATGKPRSRLFRALGEREPPAEVVVQGGVHKCHTVLKHDSWAATAVYIGPLGKVLCKFNRAQSIFGLPMHGLGRSLAEHEVAMMHRLRDLPNVPRDLGAVFVQGRRARNAIARTWIPGHPLERHERLSAAFFDKLAAVLRVMHARGLAYVDLHKPENVLVGDDGEPYLFDFQISFAVPVQSVGQSSWLNDWLPLLQAADWHHLEKHRQRHLGIAPRYTQRHRPWFIRGHRLIGLPVRWLRRRLLVALGIRTGPGRVISEHFPEDAVRRLMDDPRSAA